MKRLVFFATIATMFFFMASSSFAQSNIGLKGVGIKAGLVDPENIDSVIGFGGIVNLGTVTPNIALEGNLDFWSKTYDFGMGGDVTLQDISIGTVGKFMFSPSGQVRPYVGGGLSVHLLSYDYDTDYDLVDDSDSDTKIGIDLCGGALYALSPKMDLLGEAKYRLVSDVNQLTLQIGVIFNLGN